MSGGGVGGGTTLRPQAGRMWKEWHNRQLVRAAKRRLEEP